MQVTTPYLLAVIAVTAIVTIFTRAVPFLFFARTDRPPDYILYLGKVLPPAVMAMLLIFSVRTASVYAYPHGIPEFASLALVVLLHVWKRNTLLSIAGGTILYMILVQLIFN